MVNKTKEHTALATSAKGRGVDQVFRGQQLISQQLLPLPSKFRGEILQISRSGF